MPTRRQGIAIEYIIKKVRSLLGPFKSLCKMGECSEMLLTCLGWIGLLTTNKHASVTGFLTRTVCCVSCVEFLNCWLWNRRCISRRKCATLIKFREIKSKRMGETRWSKSSCSVNKIWHTNTTNSFVSLQMFNIMHIYNLISGLDLSTASTSVKSFYPFEIRNNIIGLLTKSMKLQNTFRRTYCLSMMRSFDW